MIATLTKIYWIARYTFLEISRSKLLYVVLLLGLIIWLISFVASEFSYGVPAKVSLDFGLGLLSLSSLGISIFLGSTLISKEIENRTIYTVLTKSTSRVEFLLGKFLGLFSIIVFNTFVLSAFTLCAFFIQGGDWSWLILWAIFFTIIESLIVLIVVVLFSLLTNSILASLYGIGFVVVGHALGSISEIYFVRKNPALQAILSFVKLIIPNLENLNLRMFVLYNNQIDTRSLIFATFSIAIYAIGVSVLSCYIFTKKQFE